MNSGNARWVDRASPLIRAQPEQKLSIDAPAGANL